MKVDRSLREVREWKDKVYQQTKHLSMKQTARKIHEDAQGIKKKYGLSFKVLHSTPG